MLLKRGRVETSVWERNINWLPLGHTLTGTHTDDLRSAGRCPTNWATAVRAMKFSFGQLTCSHLQHLGFWPHWKLFILFYATFHIKHIKCIYKLNKSTLCIISLFNTYFKMYFLISEIIYTLKLLKNLKIYIYTHMCICIMYVILSTLSNIGSINCLF